MENILITQSQLDEDSGNERFLTFTLGEESFGINIGFVTEIISMQPVFHLPEVPDYLRGIVNLRGKIIPVIDLRIKFKKEATPDTERTCIIVIDTGDLSIGLIVDKVAEVMTINSDDIAPPPDIRSGIQKNYIAGIGKAGNQIILLIDCEKLFLNDEIDTINEISGRAQQ